MRGATGKESEPGGRRSRAGAGLLLAVLLAIPVGVLPTPVAPRPDSPGSADWPPEAWQRGDIAQMSLLEQALLVAHLDPSHPEAPGLARQLEGLARMPAQYEPTARIVLAAMAEAMWHEEQALRGLTHEQRRLVLEADPLAPPSARLQKALDAVDQAEVARAAAVLAEAAAQVQALLEEAAAHPDQAPPPHGAAAAVAQRLGYTGDVHAVPPLGDVTGDELARLLQAAAGGNDPAAAAAAQQVPAPAREALARLLLALQPFAGGLPLDPEPRLVTLAATLDAVAPTLQAWSAASLAQALHAPQPSLALPAPGSPHPPLRWGRAGAGAPLPSPAPLPDEAAALAGLFLPAEAQEKVRLEAQDALAALAPEQAEALARVFAATSAYIGAVQSASAQAPPPGVDPSMLADWALQAAGGAMPDDLGQQQAMAEALPYLEALWGVQSRQDGVLAAVEGLVGPFAAPASHSLAGLPCVQQLNVSFLLAFEGCGAASQWSRDVLLSVDVGGDDAYAQRAGAPFAYDLAQDLIVAPPIPLPIPSIGIPVSIVVDLGGNDTYASGEDCAQAAACPDHPASALDPTGTPASPSVSKVAPLSVLLDWQEAGPVEARNRFEAGNRSQAHAGRTDGPPQLGGRSLHAPLAVLVEMHGDGGGLDSSYVAGDSSQGSASSTIAYHGGHAVLLRMVGNHTTAAAHFSAGRSSQGASSRGGLPNFGYPSFAAFANLAGSDSQSNDTYVAGSLSQGALDSSFVDRFASDARGAFAQAVFLDLVGARSESDDAYHSGDFSRGYVDTDNPAALARFVDAALDVSPGATAGAGSSGGDVAARPASPQARRSADAYSGGISYGRGYGRGSAPLPQSGFFDIGGTDAYTLHPSWLVEAAEVRPRNDAQWPGGADVALDDRDADGYPAFLETLWAPWRSDPGSDASSVLPNRVLVGTQPGSHVLDGAYALVLTVAGDDTYLPGFSAGIHLDLGGADKHRGRTAAASGLSTEAASDPDLGPPLGQHGLAFTWDLRGDDTYLAPHGRGQGFGEAGGVGLLVDGGGSDLYEGRHYSQGAARAGTPPGTGILLDLGKPGDGDRNVFRSPAETSRGWSEGPGATGLLIATGDHNGFQEGAGDGRTSVNLGAVNALPEVAPEGIRATASGTPAGALLQVATPYRFEADVRDIDGDDLEACWTFHFGLPLAPGQSGSLRRCAPAPGNGTGGDAGAWRTVAADFGWNETYQVHTHAQQAGLEQVAPYDVVLELADPVGAQAQLRQPFNVRNDPPVILGDLVGPLETLAGQTAAYQLLTDSDQTILAVAWGDGTPDSVSESINWAAAALGGRTRVADAAPVPGTDMVRGVENRGQTHWRLVDGDLQTEAGFTFEPGVYPLVHVGIDLPAPRQVTRVILHGAAAGAFHLSIEGVRPDGSLLPIEVRELADDGAVAVEVPGGPILKGIVLRQLMPPGATPQTLTGSSLVLNEVEVRGPGVTHEWQVGAWEPVFTVIDPHGGRDSRAAQVMALPLAANPLDLLGVPGKLAGLPYRVADVAGRGPVRHASLGTFQLPSADAEPTGPSHLVTFAGLGDGDAGATCSPGQPESVCLVVDWGDQSAPTKTDPLATGQTVSLRHDWAAPGDFTVRAWVERGASAGQRAEAFVAHVEEAFDLRLQSGPLLFLALNQSAPRTTWYSGAPAYPAIVDAAGNDRYMGGVAATAAGAVLSTNLEPRTPAFLLDLGGDDDYLSLEPGAQGFASLAAASLLLDARGDDVYVAPGHAQGAAWGHGVGVLMDLGGDDRFNPVRAAAWDGTAHRPHPALVAASPEQWAPWTVRPPELAADRPALAAAQGELVQGAADDGIGILLAHGGFDSFTAASRSQGHGARRPGASNILDYATPGGEGCLGALPDPTAPSFVPAAEAVLQCLLGVSGWTPLSDLCGGQTCSPSSQGLACPFPVPGGGGTVPVGPCSNPTIDGLTEFLNERPRYGGAAGLLVQADGAAAFHAVDASQGHSGAASRGLLVDLDGAALYSASSDAQGRTEGGEALLLSNGPNAAWLGEEGQARASAADRTPHAVLGVSAQVPVAVFAAPGDQHSCGGPGCGDATLAPGVGAGLEWNLAPFAVPAAARPALAWGAANPVAFGGPPATWTGPTLPLSFTVSWPTPVEVVALTQPAGSASAAGCEGPAIAPATLLLHDEVGSGTVGLGLDLQAALADGPVLPAGCHRVRVFARSLGAPVWSMLSGDVNLLPPPRLDMPGRLPNEEGLVELASPSEDLLARLRVREPLAALGQPPVRLRVLGTDEAPAADWSYDVGDWVAQPDGSAVAALALSPPSPGDYVVEAAVDWPGAPASPWRRLATLAVSDAGAFAIAHEAPQRWWKGAQPIPLHGTVRDFAGDLQELQLRAVAVSEGCAGPAPPPACTLDLYIPHRLVASQCLAGGGSDATCAVESVASFPVGQKPATQCPPGACLLSPPQGSTPPLGPFVEATLETGPDVGTWNWTADLQPTDLFPGGALRLQARVVSSHAVGPWQDLPVPTPGDASGLLSIDRDAPHMDAFGTLSGARATNASFPIQLEAALGDCAIAGLVSCVPGSGVDPAATAVLVRHADQRLVAVPPSAAAGPAGMFRFDWSESGPGSAPDACSSEAGPGPAQGAYEILVQASDVAGNQLSFNPGFTLIVDRCAPALAAGLDLAVPGQRWMKPGDTIPVHVLANDPVPGPGVPSSGIEWAQVALGPATAPLARSSRDQWSGLIVVPDGLLGPGQGQGTPLRVELRLRDAAGNELRELSVPIPYYSVPIQVADPQLLVRSTTATVAWSTDRPVRLVGAAVWPSGQQRSDGEVVPAQPLPQEGTAFEITFPDLAPSTQYNVALSLEDDAGYTRELDGVFHPFTTLDVATATLAVGGPQGTVSDLVTLRATITKSLPATLRLYLNGTDAQPAQTVTLTPAQTAGRPTLVRDFVIDTAHYVGSFDGAVAAEPVLRLDDGATLWSQPFPLRVDNEAPSLAPFARGAPANNGWHNRSLIVEAGAADDTAPVAALGAIGPAAPAAMPLRLESDGVFEVRVTATDGAVPPNAAAAQATFRIDRTPPALNVSTPSPWARSAEVELAVKASDAGVAPSGLDGYRLRVDDAAWTPWGAEKPSLAALPERDGPHTVEVEVRDRAGNRDNQVLALLKDTLAPSVASLQWFGTGPDGQPILEFIAQDRIRNATRAAGVDALRLSRLGPDQEPGPWQVTEGVGSVSVPISSPDDAWGIAFRDAAGNVGELVPLPARVEIPADPDAEAVQASLPGVGLVRSWGVEPARGNASTPFAFKVAARPWNGVEPTVEVLVAGAAHPLPPAGPAAADGSRLYAASVALPPTDIGAPYSHRFHLVYGDHHVWTDPAAGPTVLALDGELLEKGRGEAKPAPALGAWALLAALAVALAASRSRRRDGP